MPLDKFEQNQRDNIIETVRGMQGQMDKNTDLLVDVGSMKQQIVGIIKLCDKLDEVIEKIVEQHEKHTDRIYAEMESKKKETDSDIKEIYKHIDGVSDKLQDKMQESEDRITTQITDLRREMTEQNTIKNNETRNGFQETFDKYKWIVFGALMVVGWLLTHMNIDILRSVILK